MVRIERGSEAYIVGAFGGDFVKPAAHCIVNVRRGEGSLAGKVYH
jgi:hypothetical protein